jgi:cysteine synthase A
MQILSSSLNRIGNTPLLRLRGVEREECLQAELYAKLEGCNPAGSVKDRVALSMIEAAESQGLLQNGGTIVEATSGNTGVGLAYVCAIKGYPFIAVMPETASRERKALLKAYGAKLVLTDGAGGMLTAVETARQIAKEQNAYYPDQFSNPANPIAHYTATAVEIYRDLPSVDIFVAGIGSGGTISGMARYLKEKNPNLLVVGVEPEGSPLLTKGKVGRHNIEGIGAGFLPKTLDRSVVDEVLCVEDCEAYQYARAAARLDGALVGVSSGAALCVAVRLAKRTENNGKKIVVIFPDSGDRYLSTELFCEGGARC